MQRRNFIADSLKGAGLLVFGGSLWKLALNKSEAKTLFLRPPAALDEKEFLKHCIKCGLCVEACPYNTLKLADFVLDIPVGTPYFEARKTPCYMCPDIPCIKACPTKALDKDKILNNEKNPDINKAQMGVAILDKKSCVAFWGIQCDACYRACPLMGKALFLKLKHNERTGKHAFLRPVVDSDVCTGCGKCEYACITKEPAIRILPRKVALGEVGEHYIKGWDKKDEKRLLNLEENKLKSKDARDYLNSSKELFDD